MAEPERPAEVTQTLWRCSVCTGDYTSALAASVCEDEHAQERRR
ncbi:hypothetical protein [Mumia sp. DW29H23]